MAGVTVVDVAEPWAPEVVAQMPAVSAVDDVALDGSVLYAADGSHGLVVYDVSQPTLPVEAAEDFERLPFDHPVYIMFSSGTTKVSRTN